MMRNMNTFTFGSYVWVGVRVGVKPAASTIGGVYNTRAKANQGRNTFLTTFPQVPAKTVSVVFTTMN